MDPCPEDELIFSRCICNELPDDKLKKFCRHLQVCDRCQARLAQEQALTDLLRQSRPLYVAPGTLRAHVFGIFAGHLTTASQAVPGDRMQILDSPAGETLMIDTRAAAPDVEGNESPKIRQPCARFQRLRGTIWRR